MLGTISGGIPINSMPGKYYLMIPKDAPRLRAELAARARAHTVGGKRVIICTADTNDRVSCFAQVTSIPLFKLGWALTAEKAYEASLLDGTAVGLHMSETAGGLQWSNFSNLLPRSTWPIVAKDYANSREQALANRADRLFELGRTHGLVVGQQLDGAATDYKAFCMPRQYRPDALLLKTLERANADTRRSAQAKLDEVVKSKADALYEWAMSELLDPDNETPYKALRAKGLSFEECKLWTDLSNYYASAGEQTDWTPDNYDEWWKRIGRSFLRRQPQTMYDLEGSLLVMEELTRMVNEQKRNRELSTMFARYLVLGLFTYDNGKKCWKYFNQDKDLTEVLEYIYDDIDAEAQYYKMFNAFRKQEQNISAAVKNKYEACLPNSFDPADRGARIAEIRAAAAELYSELRSWLEADPVKGRDIELNASGMEYEMLMNFYNALRQQAYEISQTGLRNVQITAPAPRATSAAPAARRGLF